MRTNKHIALLLAGGKGCRMHQQHPKQFIEIEGDPLIAYTLDAFEQHQEIDAIYVVCDQSWEATVKNIAAQKGMKKFAGCFPSGATSMQSLYNGIVGLETLGYGDQDLVLTHDSVRPLISGTVISNNLSIATQYGNAITGVQSNEAYIVSKDRLHSEGLIEREKLFRAQTPQTFRLKDLLPVLKNRQPEELQQAQSLYTLMTQWGNLPLHIAQGDNYNFKVTVPGDIEMVQALISWRNRNR